MWKIVNKERGKGNSIVLDFTDVVKRPDGNAFTSKQDLVNAVNERFLGAASACGAPKADVTGALGALSASRPPVDRSLRFMPFTASEVYRLITSRIPPKTSKDIYGLNMKLLRTAAISLSPILAAVFNACLRDGVYPDALKISKVAPIFKGKGKRDDMDGYRPVSIIPAVGKVLENGLSSRLQTFLAAADVLSDRQHAYREGRSTVTLTRELNRRILAAREAKQQVAILCCDLSKAFDVADHSVVEAKLQHYGVRGASLSLLTSMMRGRSQVVVGGGGAIRSVPLCSSMGVAQGSSISNIMFSMMLNDLPDAVKAAEILMYADDVAALVSAPSVDQLEEKINETSSQLAKWFRTNGLALNLKKTYFIHFSLSGRKYRNLKISVNDVELQQTNSTAFLGFELDSGLKWQGHIHNLCNKIGSACYALRRVARVVSEQTARSCYFATVHSLLQYGAELWGRAADWERAFRMQKRAIRAIVGIPQDESAKPHFRRLGILTLPCILILQVAVYVRGNMESYRKFNNLHSHGTRNANKLVGVCRSLAKSSKLTHIMGPSVYNKLPEKVTSAKNMVSFKLCLKRWLIEQTFYRYEDLLDSKVQ